jgi:hypothetical protein
MQRSRGAQGVQAAADDPEGSRFGALPNDPAYSFQRWKRSQNEANRRLPQTSQRDEFTLRVSNGFTLRDRAAKHCDVRGSRLLPHPADVLSSGINITGSRAQRQSGSPPGRRPLRLAVVPIPPFQSSYRAGEMETTIALKAVACGTELNITQEGRRRVVERCLACEAAPRSGIPRPGVVAK